MELRREGQLRGETPLWKAGGPFIGLGRGDIEPGLMTKCGNQGVLRERRLYEEVQIVVARTDSNAPEAVFSVLSSVTCTGKPCGASGIPRAALIGT